MPLGHCFLQSWYPCQHILCPSGVTYFPLVLSDFVYWAMQEFLAASHFSIQPGAGLSAAAAAVNENMNRKIAEKTKRALPECCYQDAGFVSSLPSGFTRTPFYPL